MAPEIVAKRPRKWHTIYRSKFPSCCKQGSRPPFSRKLRPTGASVRPSPRLTTARQIVSDLGQENGRHSRPSRPRTDAKGRGRTGIHIATEAPDTANAYKAAPALELEPWGQQSNDADESDRRCGGLADDRPAGRTGLGGRRPGPRGRGAGDLGLPQAERQRRPPGLLRQGHRRLRAGAEQGRRGGGRPRTGPPGDAPVLRLQPALVQHLLARQ